MKFFSVPADFKTATIDGYHKLNIEYDDSKVAETYGQITTKNIFESGRSTDLLPKVDYEDLARYVEYSSNKNIKFNYTFNAPQMGNKEFTEEGMHKLHAFFGELHKAGVSSVTIALPSLIEMVKAFGYGFEIKASTICQITNSNKALNFKKIGVDRIVVDESINRDFEKLSQIREAFGEKVELIANAVCYKDCIYRMFHYNQMSEDSVHMTCEASTQYYSHRCIMKRYENVSNIMRLAWIRPEDLQYYTNIGINYFKLQGRQAVLKGNPLLAVESYFKASYEGNLMDLLDMFSPTNRFKVFVDNKKLDAFVKPFAEGLHHCNRDCMKCNYCDTFAKKSIDMDKADEITSLANSFYNEYDLYKNNLKEVLSSQEEKSIPLEMDIKFDL